MKLRKVVSLFDGMSCCQIALNRLGWGFQDYYAAEIDEFAKKVTSANYPNTNHLGDITQWRSWDIDWGEVDLITGGFPCQPWSNAGNQEGDKDERGKLFWDMLDIMKEVLKHNPEAKFLIENVKMKKEFEEYITRHTEAALGDVYKILINSTLVSAQSRKRYYWTNFKTTEPEGKGITLNSIIEGGYYSNRDKSYCIDANYGKGTNFKRYFYRSSRQLVLEEGYNPSISCEEEANVVMHRDGNRWRKLLVKECEKLQTVPVGYVDKVDIPLTQKYKVLGNGWTVDVITHLLKDLDA